MSKFQSDLLTFFFITLMIFQFGSCRSPSFQYTVEQKINPLTPESAVLIIKAESPFTASIKVLNEDPSEQQFNTKNKELNIPIEGLQADKDNQVILKLNYNGGEVEELITINTRAKIDSSN